MGKVEQKVSLNPADYIKELRRMQQFTQDELKRVRSEFNESGNSFEDFGERVKKKTKEANSSIMDLAKGFKSAFAGLSLAGLGAAAGGAMLQTARENLNMQGTVNRMGARQGLNDIQKSELKNAILDVSSKTGVSDDLVAQASSIANQFGAPGKESVKFAEVIAKASQTAEGLDPVDLAEKVTKDLRSRGQDVTAANAQKSVEAMLTASRAGFGDIGQAFDATGQVEGAVQRRANLSQRDIVNMMSGARLGADVAPKDSDAAIRDLIKVSDQLEGEALQGVLGSFRGDKDKEGNREFLLGTKQLDEAAKRLSAIGDDRVQRKVLGELGMSDEGVEGFLGIIRSRKNVDSQRRRVEADDANLDSTFDESTSGVGDTLSRFYKRMKNSMKRDREVEEKSEFSMGRLGTEGLGMDAEERSRRSNLKGKNPFPTQEEVDQKRTPQGQGDNAQTATPPAKGGEQKVNLLIEVQSTDPGFLAIPKQGDLSRTPRGL